MEFLFVETSAFAARVGQHLSDDEYGELQWFLVEHPGAGAVIRGTGGIRKVRWSTAGRGKRGGVRVVYYWRRPRSRIYLLAIYGKSVEDDLSAAQRKALRQLVGEIENE